MKIINLTIVSVFLFFGSLWPQDNFKVIKVSGNILIQRTGTALDIGTEFGQKENLFFKNTDSRAAVINPQKGRFLITASNKEDFAAMKSNFLPASSKISTRAGALNNMNDLKTYFEGNFVIFDKTKIKVVSSSFPMNEKKYFYIRYTYKNEDINKKLAFVHDTLIIDKKELLTVDGRPIPNQDITEMKLMYMEQGEKYVSTPICAFNPVFPDFDILKKEVQLIISATQNKPFNEKFGEISSFISDFYGKPEENNLKAWLNINFSLSEKK